MSGFLANLVRRSVGTAPMIRMQPPEAADVDPASSEPDAAEAGLESQHHAAPTEPMAAIQPALPAAVAFSQGDVPTPPVVSQPIAVAAAPLIQRFSDSARPNVPLAPSAAPTQPAASSSAPAIAIAASTGNEAALPPAAITSRIAPEPTSAVVATRVHQTEPEAVISPRRAAPTMEPRTIDRAVTIRPLMETTRTSDRAASADNGPLPVPQFPPIAAPVPETLVVPERVVHVRIGAIEIHAAAAPPAAPAAAAPPPPANVSSGERGFDRYARLRSYAAWDR